MDVTFQIVGIGYSNVASRRSRQSLFAARTDLSDGETFDRVGVRRDLAAIIGPAAGAALHAVSPYAGDRLNDEDFGYDTCTGYRR
jgi:hypothetical protein